jgi:hypothetical protein
MAGLVVVPPADNVLAVVGVEAADRALRSTHDVSDAEAHAVVRQCDGTLLRVTVLVVSEATKIEKVLSPKRTGTIEPLMGDLEKVAVLQPVHRGTQGAQRLIYRIGRLIGPPLGSDDPDSETESPTALDKKVPSLTPHGYAARTASAPR